MKQLITSLVIVVVIMLVAGIGFIYSGIFDVAATTKDSALVSWVLETTRENSIESRSEGVVVPDEATLTKPETLQVGFEHYDEMCVVCHGAPGVDAGEAREGLNPEPPLLAKLKDLTEDPPGELFWIIKNGIKMTGMPAWGPTHNDEKIWAMVAFVRKLPNMSAEEYKALRKPTPPAEQVSKQDNHHDDHPHTHAH